MSDLNGGIPEAALDEAHIGPMQTRVVCKVLLGESPLGTLLSDNLGERG